MTDSFLEVRFVGAEADEGKVDARSGTETLAGLTAAMTRIMHFASTGEVRFRQPFADEIPLYLEHTAKGSLRVLFGTAKIGSKATARKLADAAILANRVIKRAIGQAADDELELSSGTVSSGTIDALAESIEPSLRRAHSWTTTRGKSVLIDVDQATAAKLDTSTAHYLKAEVEAKSNDVQDVSVGALNVNSRHGRVYFHDLKRSVPFYVPRDATGRTVPTLSRFLTEYADKSGATVNISFKRVYYQDGRLKRVIISDCYPIKNNT